MCRILDSFRSGDEVPYREKLLLLRGAEAETFQTQKRSKTKGYIENDFRWKLQYVRCLHLQVLNAEPQGNLYPLRGAKDVD